ncbi:MAG: DVUA0089 family protein [Planctomycetaceae bacterium]
MFRSMSRGGRFASPLSIENLEARLPMSADMGITAAESLRQIEWNGRRIDAFQDAWVARAADRAATVADLGLPVSWRGRSLGEGFFMITAPGAETSDVVGWAVRTPGVAAVEPDFAIASTALPNDPSLGSLWGLRNLGQSGGVVGADIRAETAWNTTTGSRSVVVAVIDSGVDYRHADLAANIWTNPREIAGDGIDNDRNGFVDDVRGYDFANGDGDPMDDNGHGTHVAGTIGAVGNNGVGVTGVAWQVSIMPLKFLNGSGSGSTSNALAAINYATQMRRDYGVNIVATNNSWGGGGFSMVLRDAIEAGGRAGILFVAAAGNDGTNIDVAPQYPAAYPGTSIISVAATARDNSLAGFSNHGGVNVDLAAPGAGIVSTVPGNAYATYSGTSMATPHVTGAVALLAAAYPTANAAQIRSAILGGVTPVAGLTGRVVSGGLLDAAGALTNLAALARSGTAPPSVTPTPAAPATVAVPTPATSIPPAMPPAADAGDTLAAAFTVPASTRLSGIVGDGAAAGRDVDLYRVVLRAGQSLVIDIDARTLPSRSRLDSFVRLFNASGTEVARNDDAQGSLDSYLVFTAPTAGSYFVGVSGFRNSAYNPITGLNTARGSIGAYEVVFTFGATSRSNAVRMLGMRDETAVPAAAPVDRSWRAPAAFAVEAETASAGHRAGRRR